MPVDFEPVTPGTMAILLAAWAGILTFGAATIAALLSSGVVSAGVTVGGIAFSGLVLPIAFARRTDAGRVNPRYAVFVGLIVPYVWCLSMTGALAVSNVYRGGDFASILASLQAADAATLLILGAYLDRRHGVLALMGIGLFATLPIYNVFSGNPSGPAGPFFLAAIAIVHATGAMYYLGWRSRETRAPALGSPPFATLTASPGPGPEGRNPP
ncbi:MAG: hypothetical protein E6K16_01140 [Methanobacteriota archaeon]|nr:MAG: hypothetical protein E6K16_01140 [Euryarchaeota archaeon]